MYNVAIMVNLVPSAFPYVVGKDTHNIGKSPGNEVDNEYSETYKRTE